MRYIILIEISLVVSVMAAGNEFGTTSNITGVDFMPGI